MLWTGFNLKRIASTLWSIIYDPSNLVQLYCVSEILNVSFYRSKQESMLLLDANLYQRLSWHVEDVEGHFKNWEYDVKILPYEIQNITTSYSIERGMKLKS